MRKVIQRNISFDEEKKLYYVCFNYGKNAEGKQEKVYKTYSTKKEAKEELEKHEMRRKLAKLEKKDYKAPEKLTIEEAIEQFFSLEKTGDNKLAVSTEATYRKTLAKYFLPFCKGISKRYAKDVTRKDFQAYFKMLAEKKGLSGETRRKHYTILKGIYAMLEKDEIVERNPLCFLNPPRGEHNHEMNICTAEEAAKMILAFQGDTAEIAILMGLYMGLRREEIDGLKWENVDLFNRCLSITNVRICVDGKTYEKGPKTLSSKRTLYIPDRVLKKLQQIKAEQEENKSQFGEAYMDSGYVLTAANGKPFSSGYTYQHAKLIQKKEGLRHVSMHDLRRSFSSTAYTVSNDVLSIGQALGHHKRGVTEAHYIKALDTHSKDVIQKVAAIYEAEIAKEQKKRAAA